MITYVDEDGNETTLDPFSPMDNAKAAIQIFYRDRDGNQHEATTLDDLDEDGWITRFADSPLEDTTALERAARRWGKAAVIEGGDS